MVSHLAPASTQGLFCCSIVSANSLGLANHGAKYCDLGRSDCCCSAVLERILGVVLPLVTTP